MTLMRGNNSTITPTPNLSRSEVADLLSTADAIWYRQIDHVACVNSVSSDPYIALAQEDIDMVMTAMGKQSSDQLMPHDH